MPPVVRSIIQYNRHAHVILYPLYSYPNGSEVSAPQPLHVTSTAQFCRPTIDGFIVPRLPEHSGIGSSWETTYRIPRKFVITARRHFLGSTYPYVRDSPLAHMPRVNKHP